jgi:hypothetical protein
MRYLINRQTDEVVLVDDNDDARFYELLAKRDDNRRQVYVQTGPQDPRVEELELPGQSPTNAGDPVPPAPAGGGEQPALTADELGRLKLDDLEGLAQQRGVEVTGTGQDGRVLKKDYVAALTA